MSQHKTEVHREFELERLILFSDAVFAIAITLLIIEVKFPEMPAKNLAPEAYREGMHHLLAQVVAFIISFFFIGNFWMRHLRFCKVLKHYNETLIKLNLLFLFFIVTFPFCATVIAEHTADQPLLALGIYVGNIMCCTVSFVLLLHYVLRINQDLAHKDQIGEQEKMFNEVKFTSLNFLLMLVLAGITAYFTHNNFNAVALSVLIFPLMNYGRNRRMKIRARRAAQHPPKPAPEAAPEQEDTAPPTA